MGNGAVIFRRRIGGGQAADGLVIVNDDAPGGCECLRDRRDNLFHGRSDIGGVSYTREQLDLAAAVYSAAKRADGINFHAVHGGGGGDEDIGHCALGQLNDDVVHNGAIGEVFYDVDRLDIAVDESKGVGKLAQAARGIGEQYTDQKGHGLARFR